MMNEDVLNNDEGSRKMRRRLPRKAFALVTGMVVAGVVTAGVLGSRATAEKATTVPSDLIDATHLCVEDAIGRKVVDGDHLSAEELPSFITCMRSNGQAEGADLLEKSLADATDGSLSDKSGGPTAKCVRGKGFAVSDGFNPVISAADVPVEKRAAFADAWVGCGQLTGSSADNVRNLIMRADRSAADEQRALDAANPPTK
jgi:hypothetical protein